MHVQPNGMGYKSGCSKFEIFKGYAWVLNVEWYIYIHSWTFLYRITPPFNPEKNCLNCSRCISIFKIFMFFILFHFIFNVSLLFHFFTWAFFLCIPFFFCFLLKIHIMQNTKWSTLFYYIFVLFKQFQLYNLYSSTLCVHHDTIAPITTNL